jgi:Tfp pilus assembly protein PilN
MTTPSSANLLPAHYRTARKGRRIARRIIVGAAGYCAMLIIAVVLTLVATTPGAPGAEAKLIDADLGRTTTELQRTRQELAVAQRRLIAVQRLTARADWSLLLPVIAEQVRDGAWLSELRIDSAGKSGQYTVQLRGEARTYAAASGLALKLERVGLFGSTQLKHTDRVMAGAGESVSFDILCTLEDPR